MQAIDDGELRSAVEDVERKKASIRARVEHPFRVLTRQFGYVKVRFRGLAKNGAQVVTLLALANLWKVRKWLLREIAGELRPAAAG